MTYEKLMEFCMEKHKSAAFHRMTAMEWLNKGLIDQETYETVRQHYAEQGQKAFFLHDALYFAEYAQQIGEDEDSVLTETERIHIQQAEEWYKKEGDFLTAPSELPFD